VVEVGVELIWRRECVDHIGRFPDFCPMRTTKMEEKLDLALNQ
jgi:hypothetical protein